MKVFIGCSSKENIAQEYLENGKTLIEKISKIKGVDLVFGAFHQGLMGISYEEFKKQGKKVIGVTTEFYKEESDVFPYEKEIIVKTTTERFEKIEQESDLFLFLPGGLGTYAEIFSAIEEKTIGNDKKIILYNDNYFYTPLIKQLYHLYQEGFIDMAPKDYMIIESSKEKIVDLIKEEMK